MSITLENKLNFIGNVAVDLETKDWETVVDQYGIKNADVFSANSKYTVLDENNKKECCVGTISNGNAWECPALLRGACNVPCYGLKGFYTMYDTPKINKNYQRLILQYAPTEWLFSVIKDRATNKRCKKGNRLRFVRLNEVSDLNQRLLDKTVELCKMLLNDAETRHIVVFTYTKQGHLDFTEASKLSNLVINASQCINPVYKGGNVYIAVSEEFFNSIEETDIVKKCNCDIACVDACGYCYKDGGYIIFCKIH